MKLPRKIISVFGSLALFVLVAGLLFYRYPFWLMTQQVHFNLWRHQVSSQYIEVGGNRLHYFDAPAARGLSGKPLILIHGLGARGEDWTNMIPGFTASGFHVYVPDLLGYGRSARPDVDYSTALEESVVVQFMQAKQIPQADVIGWSMGGWIAMSLALDHPAMVNRLVIYDSAGTYFPAVLPDNLFTPTSVADVQRLTNVLEPKPRAVPSFIAKALVRGFQQNRWVVDRSLASMVSGRYLLDFRLHNLRQPMLIVWGGEDHLIPPSVGESIHRAVPQSVFGLAEDCGHLGPAECSSTYQEITLHFLEAYPPLPPQSIVLSEPMTPQPRSSF